MKVVNENILNKWYKHWRWQTSNLNVLHHNKLQFNRKDIEKVHLFLNDFFGLDYFEPTMLDKMSVDSFNPVISALIHKMPSSNFRIFEIINAIEFSKKWAPQHFNQMANTKNDTERFFPYLFESEIKTLLRHNGFLIKKEKKDEIQKYDAVMAYGSQKFIIECKKLYSNKYLFFESIWNNIFAMLNKINRQKYGVSVYGYFDIDERNPGKSAHNQKKNFNRFSNDLSNCRNPKQKYECDNEALYIFPFNTMEYNILKIEDKHTCLFCLELKEEFYTNNLNRYHAEIKFKASSDIRELNNKMKKTIRRAIEQHEKSSHLPLMIFIDNEKNISPILPLFNSKEDVDVRWIEEKIEKSSRDIIICLYFRSYDKYMFPKKEMIVFGPDKFKNLCNKLEMMNLNSSYKIN